MFEELLFRLLFVFMYFIFGGFRIYYRRKTTKTQKTFSDTPAKRPPRTWAHVAIFIGIVGMFVAYALFLLIPPWIPWFPLPFPYLLRWAGVILGLGVIPLLVWTHRTLDRFYSAELEIQTQHQLMTNGPYSRIRHPMYTTFILFTLGTVLLAANLFVTIFGLIVCFSLYPISKREEQMLLDEFGDQYHAYMNRTGRFFPRIRKPKASKEE
ncbi:MAG: isoprenylcysteine carboxylmethyltransferase family protein [Promethearchaeota archaeon]